MNNKNSKENNLFLLMCNLSQMTSKEKIIEVFIRTLNEIWPNLIIHFTAEKNNKENENIRIYNNNSSFGFLYSPNLDYLNHNDKDLFLKAVNLLASILKKNELELIIPDKKLSTQDLIENSTDQINKQVEQPENIEKGLIEIDFRKAEQNLKNSETRYRSLFEFAKEGILIIDAQNGQIVDVNPYLTEILEFSHEELLGKELWEIGTFKNIAASKEAYTELQNSEYIRFENMPMETKNGRQIAVEFISNVYLVENIKVIQCNIRDITERRQAEESMTISRNETLHLLANAEKSRRALLSILEDEKIVREEIKNLNEELEQRVQERTEQLQLANKELESFSYSISHDLRAPLRHIDGFAKLLKSKLTDDSEEVKHFLEIIITSSVKMGSMIDNLLNFSRLGRKSLYITEINMNDLIMKVIEQFESETKNRKIEWKIGELPVILGDHQLIALAFENLISNAIKFTSKKELAQIEINVCESSSEKCTLFVKDNGAGFNPEYSNKLFGVFQRLHSNKEFEGTGIGLANVKQIIKKHDGEIWATSEVDGGATFYIKI